MYIKAPFQCLQMKYLAYSEKQHSAEKFVMIVQPRFDRGCLVQSFFSE